MTVFPIPMRLMIEMMNPCYAAPRSGRPMAKRLSFGGPGEPAQRSEITARRKAAEAISGLGKVAEDLPCSNDEARLAKELRRQSMDGSIPVSLQALQASCKPPHSVRIGLFDFLKERMLTDLSNRICWTTFLHSPDNSKAGSVFS